MQINGKVLCDNCFAEITKEPCPLCNFEKSTYHPVIGVLPVGTVLRERYHIGKVLGEGGFGVTYKAYDTLFKCPVAVKEYYPSGMAHRDTGSAQVSVRDKTLSEDFQAGAEKFCEEAKTLSRFNGNPNIVGVYDYFQENGTAYFIMEYLDGMDLKHYIKLMGGKLTQENVLHIARAVSDALLITHSMNVLHRDISPDNIYITSDGKIKLIDFGAARQVMSQQSKSLSVILKQGFAPLEQYQRKGKQGSWTDIYALGATMYYALTGKIPDDVTERIEEPEIGKAEDYGVDPEFWAVIDKCMAVKISDRYGETFELKHDLNKLKVHEKELERPAPQAAWQEAAQTQQAQEQQSVKVDPQPQAQAAAVSQTTVLQAAQAKDEQQSQKAAMPVSTQQSENMPMSAQQPLEEDYDKTVAFGGNAAYAQQPQDSYLQSQSQGYYQQPQGYDPAQQSQGFYPQQPQGYYQQPQGYDPAQQMQGFYPQSAAQGYYQGFYPQSQQSQGYYQQGYYQQPQTPQGYDPKWYYQQQFQMPQGFYGQVPQGFFEQMPQDWDDEDDEDDEDVKKEESYKMPDDDRTWSEFERARQIIEWYKNR